MNPLEKFISELKQWGIVGSYRGSIAHGTYVPHTDPDAIDDIDLISICVPTPDYYIGVKQFGSRGTKDYFAGQFDVVEYELKKAISMLCNFNPNIAPILYTEPIFATRAGRMLLDNRNLFATKKAFATFSGYANGQHKKMLTANAYEGYMGEKRKQLVTRYGYDTKMASHTIRLLRMAVEYFTEDFGELIVNRPDAEELIEIKQGGWSLDMVNAEIEDLEHELVEKYNKSNLPVDVDWEKVNWLTKKIIVTTWEERNEY